MRATYDGKTESTDTSEFHSSHHHKRNLYLLAEPGANSDNEPKAL